MKIAITGATGQLGELIIQALLTHIPADNIVALVRNKTKALKLKQQNIELRHFDYDSPETLAPALIGIDKLLLISANEIGRRTAQHQAVIEAVKNAKVPYIAYTSLLRANTSPLGLAQEHRETEALIQASGLTYTFLRNNWYSENYIAGVVQNAASGQLFSAAKDGKISSASRTDYAEAAAIVLASTNHDNKTYELAGSENFTKLDLAKFIEKASGKKVSRIELSASDLTHGLQQAGLPETLISVIVDADIQTVEGAMYSESKDLEQLIGRKTISIQSQIEALFTAD
ncbi:SDR family oxidoreductase [Acinetobacter sp. 1207_04]|uniref:SDR family oxidoreductase n=1 Tax=Acinetobacter sp. 1207_04 TaxID=2604449 RepID=UPI004058631D